MNTIILHGVGQSALNWQETISYMEKEVLCPDLFTLVKGEELTYQNLYKKVAEIIEQTPGPISLIGLSLGALLALNYTIEHPGKVQSLVLIAVQYKESQTFAKLEKKILDILPEAFFSEELGLSKQESIQLENSLKHLDFSSDLEKISSPTLILCGEKDRLNKRAAKELVQKIPGAELKFVKGAGHDVNKYAPQELANILNEFLQKTSQV